MPSLLPRLTRVASHREPRLNSKFSKLTSSCADRSGIGYSAMVSMMTSATSLTYSRQIRRAAIACLLANMSIATAASATESYMQTAIGAREKGLAGAGVANSGDATAASLNPAGLVNVGTQITSSVSFLNLRGGFNSTGTGGAVADGRHMSEKDWLAIPNFAANWRVNWGFADAVALTMYGNGGVLTRYGDMSSTACNNPFGGAFAAGTGVYCRGALGVNMQQNFISVAFAKRIAPGFSVGVAPILARQTVEVDGAALFAPFSASPANFSNRGMDEAWGGGVRAGIEWQMMQGVKFGVAGNSRVYMSKFDKYRGLFAEQGSLDAPPSLQAGVAIDVRRDLTMMLDYKHIWFSSVRAMSNASDLSPTFGANNGPGFGIQDLNIYKIAFEWRANQHLTLRAGYSYNNAPVTSRDADLSIMTLGQVQHHFATGLKVALTHNLDLELAAMYAPRASVTGPELNNPTRTVSVDMSEFEFTVGAVYRFGAERAPQPLK